MSLSRVANGPDALLSLEAERAGSAWACVFSSSDEFEAAIIQSRRRAGAFGPSSRRKRIYLGCAVGMSIILLLVLI